MQNPMMGVLNQNRFGGMISQIKQIKQRIGSLQSLGNPQAALNQLMSQNPQMRQAMQYVQQNGGDPKQAMIKLAQEQGLDPQSIFDAIR